MNEEEVFVRNEADDLTRRIVDRLGQRQEKLDRMAEWDKPAKAAGHRRLYIAGLAIAASIAVVFILAPWRSNTALSPLDDLGIGAPQLTEFRSAMPELSKINQLIESKDYEAALAKTKEALAKSDYMLTELANVGDMWGEDEALQYEEQLEREANSQLRWAYIYLLVKTERNKEAKKELKRYLKDTDFCEHEQDARELLSRI